MEVREVKAGKKHWYIAKFTKNECAKIGLEYPTFSVWEHDEDYVYKNINMHLEKTDAEWWWRRSETDADTYEDAVDYCFKNSY